MRDLVALAVPGGPAFVDALRRAWDDGDAVLPVDARLPGPALDAVLAALAPTLLVDDRGERHRLDGGVPVDDGDAVVVSTSGTTGTPRGVVLTHEAVRASALATSARLRVDPTTDRWLACLPLAHVGGLSVVLRALVTGTPLTVLPGFDATAVDAADATLVSLVASTLSRVRADRFRVVVLGGSAPPPHLPTNAVTTYGMTETGSGIVYDGVALDGVDVAIGADDEIRVRGPMLLRAYRDGVDPKDAHGWLATGDVGVVDADGRLVVRGRRGDMIVTGGENVWPEPVERVLATHPRVREVAVVGVPDDEWGERVVAFVVPIDRAAPPTLDALRAHAKAELPAWCAPRQLVLMRTLPRTDLGKVRRAALRVENSVTRSCP